MKKPFINAVIANEATKTGITLLMNKVIDSATNSNMKNIIPKIVALPASLFKSADGYKIITKQKLINKIKGIIMKVFAITYDATVYDPLLYSLIKRSLSSKNAGIPATLIKQGKATAKKNNP